MHRLDEFELKVILARDGPTCYFTFYDHKECHWRREYLQFRYKSVAELKFLDFLKDTMPRIFEMIEKASPM